MRHGGLYRMEKYKNFKASKSTEDRASGRQDLLHSLESGWAKVTA